MEKLFGMPVSSVYPHYVTKVERKGRTASELDEAICWLTGFTNEELRHHLAVDSTFADFFESAEMHPRSELITGVVCGVRVETLTDPLEQKIRYLDKLVDEIARGWAMEKVLR